MADKREAQERAARAIKRMQGGPILALSPARSEEILAECFQELIDERDAAGRTDGKG